MILDKDTRDSLKIGDVLRSTYYSYLVTNLQAAGKGYQVTVQIISSDCYDGRKIYLQPLSEFYGLTIERN